MVREDVLFVLCYFVLIWERFEYVHIWVGRMQEGKFEAFKKVIMIPSRQAGIAFL